MNASIVAIGGGEIKAGTTLAIDRRIVSLSGKERPTVLFIPTASGDAGGYINAVSRVYRSLGCKFTTLLYKLDKNADQTAAEKIDAADIIYVGGGDTRTMIEIWREHGADRLLLNAANSNKVLCGLSAGSICWFSSGYSDSDSFSAAGEWSFCEVGGLGLLPFVNCPHFDEPDRAGFVDFMKSKGGAGIAINADSAFIATGGRYETMGSVALVNGAGVSELGNGEISELL